MWGVDPRIVTDPDFDDPNANALRKALLFPGRGYPVRFMFQGYPPECEWQWCHVHWSELTSLHYANCDTWANEYSAGTCEPSVGAQFMEANPTHAAALVCQSIVREVEGGSTLPPMIVVGIPAGRLVVMEGNARLTAMVMAGEQSGDRIQILLGTSPRMNEWAFYNASS